MSDAALRDIARLRPASIGALGRVKGIGERKLADVGARFVEAVLVYSGENNLSTGDVVRPQVQSRPNPGRDLAFKLFDRGRSVEDVAAATGRAPSTIGGYLAEFINERRPTDISAWVSEQVYRRVLDAARETDSGALKPIFEHLSEEVPYEQIRAALALAQINDTAGVATDQSWRTASLPVLRGQT